MNDRANDIGNILERAWAMGTMGGILNPYSNFDFGRGKGDYDYGQTTELFRGVREGRPFDSGSTGYPFNQQSAANYGNPPYSPPQTPPQSPPGGDPVPQPPSLQRDLENAYMGFINWINQVNRGYNNTEQQLGNAVNNVVQPFINYVGRSKDDKVAYPENYSQQKKVARPADPVGKTPPGWTPGVPSGSTTNATNTGNTNTGSPQQAIYDWLNQTGNQIFNNPGFGPFGQDVNKAGATAQQAVTNPVGLASQGIYDWLNQTGTALGLGGAGNPAQNAPSLPQGQQTTSALPFNIGASSQPVTPPAQNAGVQPAQTPANTTPANTTNVPFNQQNTDTSYGGQQDMYSGGQISFNPNNPSTQNTKNPPTGGTPGTSGGKSVKGDPYSDWKPRLEKRGLNWNVLVDVYLNPNRRGTWGRYGNPDAEIQEAAQNYQDDKLWGDTFYEFYGRGPNAQEWTEHYESRTTYIDGYNYILRDPLFTGNPMAEQSYNQKVANLKEMERKEDNKWYYDNPPQNRW